MSLIDRKIAAFTKIIAMLPDQPNAALGLTGDQLKVWFDTASEELRTEFNGLIDDLTAQTGGEDIGFTGAGFASTKLSAAVRELLVLAQAAQAGTILPGTVDKPKLAAALQAEIDAKSNTPIAGGSDTAIAVTVAGITSYTQGLRVSFIASEDNSGLPTTLNVNGLGAKNLYSPDGITTPTISVDGFYDVRYNGTNFTLVNAASKGAVGSTLYAYKNLGGAL